MTVYFVAFDLLAEDDDDGRGQPYWTRRRRLEQLLADVEPPLWLSPATSDRDLGQGWMNPAVAQVGVEGLVAKRVDRPYRPGRTGDWVRVRHTTVVDAVVIGMTEALERPEELVLARRDDTSRTVALAASASRSCSRRDG